MSPRKTIIIGCSDEYLRWRLANWLRSAGYAVIEAASGAKTLARALDPGVDLILLDSLVSGIVAEDVCRYLRIQPGCRNIPLLVLAAEGKKDMYFKAGADAVIDRGVERQQLLQRLQEHLSPPAFDLNKNIKGLALAVWAERSARSDSG